MSAIIARDEALRLLSAGAVVAVPTDTVYGLAAALAHPGAIAALFSMKRRPATTALPVLIDTIEALEGLEVRWPENARRLSEAFWPGALTIVVNVPFDVARLVGATIDTAGFRIPNDELLLGILEESGPLAVSSANEHGAPPCHSAEEVLAAFTTEQRLGGVLDGGERSGGVSTVVEVLDSSWRIVRHGACSDEEVTRVLS